MELPFYGWGRIPNRQWMVAMLALAVLAGLGIASLRGPRARALTLLATVLILLEFVAIWPYPMGSAALAQEPIWRALRAEGRGAVLSLPQWDFFGFPPANEALLAQTAHGRPLVGGYIHRLPPGSAETAKAIQELVVPPDEDGDIVPRPTGAAALRALRELGIAYVLLHRDARSPDLWGDEENARAAAQLQAWAGEPRWQNQRFALYELPHAATLPATPTATLGEPLWSLDPRWFGAEGDPGSVRRWMPDRAAAWLWLAEPQAAHFSNTRLVLDAQAFNGPRTLALYVNGVLVWKGPINERTVIESERFALVAGHNQITLELAEGCQRPSELDPAAGDGRCLGLLVHGLWLAP